MSQLCVYPVFETTLNGISITFNDHTKPSIKNPPGFGNILRGSNRLILNLGGT